MVKFVLKLSHGWVRARLKAHTHVRARVHTHTNTRALPSVPRGMWPHRQAAAGNTGSQKTAYLFSSELQTPSAFHYSAPPATVNKFVSSLAH